MAIAPLAKQVQSIIRKMPKTSEWKKMATSEVIRKIFPIAEKNPYGGLTWETQYPDLRSDFSQLLRVIAATPKKATSYIKSFELKPGRSTTGSWHPDALRVVDTSEEVGPMASTYAHEAGHGASIPMMGKILKRKGYKFSPDIIDTITGLDKEPEHIRLGVSAYQSYLDDLEGIAEYLGRHIQRKAGYIPNEFYGHGELQREVTQRLERMASKNPYMNVYRYLNKITR